MKSSAILSLLVVAACASGGASNGVGSVGGGDQDANVKHVMIEGSGMVPGSVDLQADARSNAPIVWHDINVPLAATWQAIPDAYKKLGLSITRYDSVTHIIEGERLRSRADFGGKQLISLMDCGDVMGMPNVTRFEVNIQTRTVLRSTTKGSTVASTVIATSKPGGVAGILTPCLVNPAAADQVAAALQGVVR